MTAIASLLALLIVAGQPGAPAEAPRRYRCRYLPAAIAAPVIDGRAEDAAWASAPWSEQFIDIEGAAKPVPRLATRFKAIWDATSLYLLAELEEPQLFATLREHDAVIFEDPDFELFLDPDGDTRHYFELEINALGTTWDLALDRPYHEGGKAEDSWELVGLRSAVGLDGTLNDSRNIDRGWTVELAIPWSAMAPPGEKSRPPEAGSSWRVNFSRVEWPLVVREDGYAKRTGAPEDNWVWTPQGRIDMHRPERWGFFDFVQ